MKAYLLRADPRYQGLVPSESDGIVDVYQRFDGTAIGGSWRPLRVEVDDDQPDDLLLPDFPSLSVHIPVFSKRASDALRDSLAGSGELLPLSCECGEYFAFNVTSVIDALDTDASEIVYFASGRIMDVRRYVLDADQLEAAVIFKLTQVPLLDVFVTDRFVELVKQRQFSGFEFKPI